MKASKKNNQATEVKVEVAPQPLTERQSLRALCKELRAKYGTAAQSLHLENSGTMGARGLQSIR